MKGSSAFVFCLFQAACASLVERQYPYGDICYEDDCERAVVGTHRGLPAVSRARTDCSNYLAETTTLLAETVSLTTTVTSTVTANSTYNYAYKLRRDAAPQVVTPSLPLPTKTIPPYATSACTEEWYYISACNCFDDFTTPTTTVTLDPITTVITTTHFETATANSTDTVSGVLPSGCSSSHPVVYPTGYPTSYSTSYGTGTGDPHAPSATSSVKYPNSTHSTGFPTSFGTGTGDSSPTGTSDSVRFPNSTTSILPTGTGVLPTGTGVLPTGGTVTPTNTTSSSPSTFPTPVCSNSTYRCYGECVDLLRDPNNCGTCGNTCQSGVCTNGVCASNSCRSANSTCGNFEDCGSCSTGICSTDPAGNRYCIVGSTYCAGLADCTSSSDCGTGEVCAVNTCCRRNICIPACGVARASTSPSRRSVRGARLGDTAGTLQKSWWTV